MLTLTEAAVAMLRSCSADGYLERPALRVALAAGSSPLAPVYDFTLLEDADVADDDRVIDLGEFRVVVDAASAQRVDGATIDYVDRAGSRGFDVRLPSSRPANGGGPLAERVRQVLDERVNPSVAAHGGKITLIEVRDAIAYVEMSGGCQGCGMARVTLRQGVEKMIREAVPEIEGIQDVTDHVSGATPYYAREA